MSDNKELLLLSNLSPGDDRVFLERLQGCINHRNAHGPNHTKALRNYSGSQIKQVVVGPEHIAFLFCDNKVGRVNFRTVEVKPPAVIEAEKTPVPNNAPTVSVTQSTDQTSTATSGTTGTQQSGASATYAAVANVANRSAKIRRVMMATRRAGQFATRGGVIVDRGRQLIPATSIPEDLIAQAQVVLQGKSREVIVRELQRTNLNVNEAVNNLLSREDDDEDMDDGSDSYLPEELLSLLDAGLRSSDGIMEPDGLYSGEGYEYLMSREFSSARRREGRNETSRTKPAEVNTVREKFEFGDEIEFWTSEEETPFPPNVKKFTKIAAFQGELLALSDTGYIYGWKWREKGDLSPHPINAAFFGTQSNDHFVDIETSAYRAVVLTANRRMGSFFDTVTLGQRVSEALFMPLIDVPDGEIVESIHVCPMFAAVKTTNAFYWWGINPFNERRRVFEKTKSKAKKYQSSSTSDIKIGSEVRTKSNPVYAANSVAVNLTSTTPMIGILMENAWSLTETCRFRIYTPEQYDQLKEETSKDDKKAVNLSVRKRAAPSDDHTGSSTIPIKETAWAIKDVFFVHEEPCNDTGIVQIVDGPMCGIYFKSYIEERKKNSDGSLDVSKLRLMRKDDLVVVHGGSKQPCSPVTFEKVPQRVSFPHGIRKVISLVIDNSGFRMLVEKKGRIHLMRMSTLGKLSSDHQLPVSYSAICGPHDGDSKRGAKLFNYGDDNILVLQDYNGALSPLVRNAAGGFSDPVYLGVAGMNHLAVGLKYLPPGTELSGVICSGSIEKLNKPDVARSGNKLLFMAALIAPSPKEVIPQLPSLIQLVLFCDIDGVAMFLKTMLELSHEMDEESFGALIDEYIADVRADGNRTVFHVAVMNAFAKTNALQNEANDRLVFESLDTSEADAHRQRMDKQWEEMISGKIPKTSDIEMKDSDVSNDGVKSPALGLVDLPMEFRTGRAVSDPRIRQSNAISILKMFMDSDVMKARFNTLFHVRDVNGHTPLISAVQNRAYEAATVIWDAMKKFYSSSSVDDFTTQVYNHMIHNDDSPLFIVCYNDTCSFTWTGDEHINQDIFECKTCGLTGSLCCCTECANTCHRNHDCKLKRTSPTAYCDCWEKCSCKALVAGNEKQRDYLLNELLTKTNLICQPNIRGEHLLLFLVKTVGRQLIEQENYGKRTRNRASANQAGNGNDHVPERDLEPPKFADRALKVCLGSWAAVKSLIAIGMKKRNDGAIISEELFHLSAQNGSTHLDKFIFTLLNKCPEPHLDLLLNTLMNAAGKTGDERDPDVDAYVSRFIRSVIRMFSLMTLIAPSTLAMTIQSAASNAEDDKQFKYSTAVGESKSILPTRTSVAISGVISLVRSIPLVREDRNKDKKRQINSFTQKCRRIFQALPTYSIAELLNTADAYMGPVRTGFINPALNISRAMHSTDALDYIEKYLNGEQDLSSALDVNGELRSVRRRRYGSRRDNEDDAMNSNEPNGNVNGDSDESESDSENEAISRRFSSQGSLHGHNTSSLNNIVETYRRNEPQPPPNPSSRPANGGVADRGEYSTDSVSSASDDDENEDSSDEEESDNEPTFGVSDAFNNDEFEEDEEIRENEEEEEDYYDEDGEEEAGQEFGDDAHDEDEAEYENDEEANNDRTVPVVEVEPVEQAPEPEEGEIVVGNEMEVENVANSENINPEEAVEMNDEELINAMSNDAVSVTIAPESDAIGIAVSNDIPDVSRTRSRVIRGGNTSSSGNRARNLTWAVPGDFTTARRDDGNGNELVIRTSNTAGNEGGNNDQSARANKNLSNVAIDDSHASSEKTAFQFAAVFAALLKLVDDLLLQITRPAIVSAENSKDKAFPRPLRTEFRVIKALRDHADEKLTASWQWLTIVLDKVEAQLKFGSALNSSAIFAIENQEKKSEKERKYKSKENTASTSTSKRESPQGRKEFLQYFFSTARAHAGEDGDELPIIEYRALRTAAFVAEAFLFHASVLELIDSRIQSRIYEEESKEFDAEEMARAATAVTPSDVVPVKRLKQFYQRSNSICYPCVSFADPHNAFQYSAEECLPLALRPQLLQSDADRSQLFTLPIPQRDRAEHVTAAKNHGITNPTFHSLADLPTSYSELRDLLSEKMKATTVPSRSMLKTYIGDEPLKSERNAITVDDLFAVESSVSRMPLQKLLGRWSNSFSLITQMYTDDLVHYCGGDATYSVILVETAGFHFRQSHFRKRIEKLKNGQPRDLVFSGLCREKNTLVVQTFRLLNQQYQKRISSANAPSSVVLKMYPRNNYDPSAAAAPPLASHKVKVTFKDEPGEGTGVARSFYSAVAEALTTLSNMPQDGFEPEDDKKKTCHPNVSNVSETSSAHRHSPPKRLARGALQAIQASIGRRVSTRRRQELNTKVEPYFPPEHPTPEPKIPETRNTLMNNKKLASERLFSKVYNCEPVFAHKVTGMLLEFPITDIVNMINCDDTMKAYLIEAVKLLQGEGYVNSLEKENDAVNLREDAPFFARIESSGHYVPVPATCSENRLNGFRNVGRMIGICLQQREIFPIQLARHILKYILGKSLTWYDLAFFDPKLFDSMRSLIYDDDTGNPRPKEFYDALEMNYVMTFSEKEGGSTVELKTGGEDISLTRENILEYFYLFVEKRLLGPAIPILEAIKKGVFDVIPTDCLNHLTPEDLRLILCGSPEINITLLESYTKFLDESSSSSDTLEKYKQTFWSVVNKFTHQEKQDLVFFWTGSPTLPATEEEFQPLPTIMIRPSDNNLHLPTANTCISRLYLPLYTSKRVLRAKLLLAIKARNFGFV